MLRRLAWGWRQSMGFEVISVGAWAVCEDLMVWEQRDAAVGHRVASHKASQGGSKSLWERSLCATASRRGNGVTLRVAHRVGSYRSIDAAFQGVLARRCELL